MLEEFIPQFKLNESEIEDKTEKMTFELCAELVAKEIAHVFRNTINREKHLKR